MKPPSELASPMAFSVYPKEREALQQLMQEHQLKTPFDVVRLLATKCPKLVQKGRFSLPKKKV